MCCRYTVRGSCWTHTVDSLALFYKLLINRIIINHYHTYQSFVYFSLLNCLWYSSTRTLCCTILILSPLVSLGHLFLSSSEHWKKNKTQDRGYSFVRKKNTGKTTILVSFSLNDDFAYQTCLNLPTMRQILCCPFTLKCEGVTNFFMALKKIKEVGQQLESKACHWFLTMFWHA